MDVKKKKKKGRRNYFFTPPPPPKKKFRRGGGGVTSSKSFVVGGPKTMCSLGAPPEAACVRPKGWVLFDPRTRKVRTTYHCALMSHCMNVDVVCWITRYGQGMMVRERHAMKNVSRGSRVSCIIQKAISLTTSLTTKTVATE